MAYCVNCGTEIKEGYEFCPECGKVISIDVTKEETNIDYNSYMRKHRICKMCRKENPEDIFYCLGCGATFDSLHSDVEKIKDRIWDIRKSYFIIIFPIEVQ